MSPKASYCSLLKSLSTPEEVHPMAIARLGQPSARDQDFCDAKRPMKWLGPYPNCLSSRS
jgi:hypothetical protein